MGGRSTNGIVVDLVTRPRPDSRYGERAMFNCFGRGLKTLDELEVALEGERFRNELCHGGVVEPELAKHEVADDPPDPHCQ